MRGVFLFSWVHFSALLFACVGNDTLPPDGGGPDTGADTASDVVTPPSDGGAEAQTCDGGSICNTVCVDTSSDPKNCGRCAHDCGTGACKAGICQPVLIAGDPDGGAVVTSITTDQTDDNPAGLAQHVFWSVSGASGGVFQDNVTGGNTITLSTSSATQYTNVIVNQVSVFWTIQNFGGPPQFVVRAQVSTASSQAAFGTFNASYLQSILFDPASKYVFGSYAANSSTFGLFKCGPAGSTVTCSSVVTFTGQPGGNVATDGTSIYYCDPNDGFVEQTSFSGNSSTFLTAQATPNLLRIDGTNVYWSNAGTKTLQRAAINGPTPKQLASTTSPADAIAADAVNVYWAEHTSGTLSYAPITGAGPNTPYVDLGPAASPMRLVRDTGFLYFSHNGGIYRVALP